MSESASQKVNKSVLKLLDSVAEIGGNIFLSSPSVSISPNKSTMESWLNGWYLEELVSEGLANNNFDEKYENIPDYLPISHQYLTGLVEKSTKSKKVLAEKGESAHNEIFLSDCRINNQIDNFEAKIDAGKKLLKN